MDSGALGDQAGGEGVSELKDIDIDDACLWYRHDFGLMSEQDKKALRFQAGEWLHAFSKARRIDPMILEDNLAAIQG